MHNSERLPAINDLRALFDLAVLTGASVTLHDRNDVRFAETALRDWARDRVLEVEITTNVVKDSYLPHELWRGAVDVDSTSIRVRPSVSGLCWLVVYRMTTLHVEEPAVAAGPYVDTDSGPVLAADLGGEA